MCYEILVVLRIEITRNESRMEKLTKTEEEVMLHIWRLEDCTTKEVLNELDDPKPPYTTLASVINNLKRKGFLNAKQKGLTYHYSPKIAKTEYKADFMKGFVGNYFKLSLIHI